MACAHLLRSYLSTIRSRWSCVSTRFGSHRPSHVLAHVSFPCDRMNSISSLLNVAIEIDLTRCGGVIPRLCEKTKTNKLIIPPFFVRLIKYEFTINPW